MLQSPMVQKLKNLVAGPENRETFFARIAKVYPTLSPEYDMIRRAYDAAKDGMREKYRDDGERYFEHCRLVTLIMWDYLYVRDPELICAGLLHDHPEDLKFWPVERIAREFSRNTGYYTEAVKKDDAALYSSKEERNHAYHAKFDFHPRNVFLVKLADRVHNLLTIWCWEPRKILKKLQETEAYYLPMARKHCILAHELDALVSELREKATAELQAVPQ